MTEETKIKSWELPLSKTGDQTLTPAAYLTKLGDAHGGFYPMGANGLWHGGIHLDTGTGLKANSEIGCIADGEVIAYRIDSTYPEMTYQVIDESVPVQARQFDPVFKELKAKYSTGFVLVRHRLEVPTLEVPPVAEPAPGDTPAENGTPDTPPAAPAQAPAAQPDSNTTPDTPTATPENTPAPAEAQTEYLTLYSLYMHLNHWQAYDATGSTLTRPAWWGEPTEFEVGDKATDKIRGCRVRQNGAGTTVMALLPVGTEIEFGEAHSRGRGFFKLTQILRGEALMVPGATGQATDYYVYPADMETISGNQRRVHRGVDDHPDLKGIHVYEDITQTSGTPLSVIPKGAKLKISERNGKWGKLEKLLSGKAYPELHVDVEGIVQKGWVDTSKLDGILKPQKTDEVVVLDTPYPLKTGDLIGYPGIYQKSGDTSADATNSPLLVHLEVFTPEDMPAVIQRTAALAAQQPEDKKTLIKINKDAALYQERAADKEIDTDTQLKKVENSKASGKWLEVKKECIGIVEKTLLGTFTRQSRNPIKGKYAVTAANKQSIATALNIAPEAIPDSVFFYGNSYDSAGNKVSTLSPPATYTRREIHFTPENDKASYWIEADKLKEDGTTKVEPMQAIPAWSQYPLLEDNNQAGTVYFEQVIAKKDLEADTSKVTDHEGIQWWQVKTGMENSVIGTESFGEISGWVKNKAPAVTTHHPWEWPLFNTLQETATPAQELERNQRLRLDPADRTTLMQAIHKILGGETEQIPETEEQQDTRLLKTENLKAALKYPWLSQQFSHLIVKYESEWYADAALSKWNELDRMLKKYVCDPRHETETDDTYNKRIEAELKSWQAEKEQRIKKLLWWDKIDKHGFPKDNAEVWHLHPVGLVENFVLEWDDNDPRWLIVPRGQFTFDVEGNDIEGHRYFSRVAHWPGTVSGVTIGRGYDLGQRPNPESDLSAVGITGPFYDWLIGAKGLRGNAARDYLRNASPEMRRAQITRKQQHELFLPIYDYMKSEVIRISSKADAVQLYGALVWDNLDTRLQDMVIDLIYRGDYSSTTRPHIQRFIVNNDLTNFRRSLENRGIWPGNLPDDRYRMRIQYMR